MLTLDEAYAAISAPGAPFEIAVEDVAGVPTRVFAQRMRSLRSAARIGAGHGEQTFLVYGSRRVTYAEFFTEVRSIGHALSDRYGVERGDRIAILAANRPEWAAAFWGALVSGAVAVGVNGWAKADEIVYMVNDSGAKVLIADARRFARIVESLDQMPALERVFVVDGTDGMDDGRVLDFAVLTRQVAADFPKVRIDEDDPAIVLYTSGTTGRPKGAVATHRNWLASSQNFMASRAALQLTQPPAAGDLQQGGAILATMPFFHVGGAHTILLMVMLSGRTVVMTEGRFDPERVLGLIQSERVEAWGAVPTMIWRICQHPARRAYDLSSLRSVQFGGAPSGTELRELIAESFPNVDPRGTGNAWGMTETSNAIMVASAAEAKGRPAVVGRARLTVEARVVDDAGNDVSPGTVGELWVKGPFVIRGYWNRPDATREAITDGWLHTGDVGFIDDEGFVSITERKRDMIIRGGENIYPAEIEERLLAHDAVGDAAVIGVAHPELGEEVKAIVQVDAGAAVTPAELQAWVAVTLADFKVPAHVELRTQSLPRTPSGKLIKSELRAPGDSVFEEHF